MGAELFQAKSTVIESRNANIIGMLRGIEVGVKCSLAILETLRI